MPTRSKVRRTKRSRSSWDWYLLGLVVLAVVVLGSFFWVLVRARTRQAEVPPDFAVRLRELAAERGAASGEVLADQPIRKVEGVFVRTWSIRLPSRPAMEALESDIAGEVGKWRGRLTEKSATSEGGVHLWIDFEREAFDIRLQVARRERVVRRAPTEVPTRAPTATPKPKPRPRGRGKLAILLDDAGQSLELLAATRSLPKEIGVAILPFLPYSSDVASAMHRAGHEVWLHLPMEPEGYPRSNPGPGAVLVSMTDSEIRVAVHAAVNDVPHAVGVNNHMGSKATADLRTMTWVMQELKGRGLSFIDSRTTRRTVAEEAARAQGVPASRRHVFLDNERTRNAVRGQLEEAIDRSRAEGEIIALGHLAKVTIEVLKDEAPNFKRRGVDLVPPSKLVR
jgi:polysaccharide deacetylase 2 family uncharacterized protein YibQ